ncbi:sulfate adenylyltransferase subunit CysD [Pseudomonas poae]|uniref:Sulfate adenylyltransferase subunit 2 n=2 Tax=Pseudomonas poae TaxID=200451 RepID=A0A2S9EXR5_9PSED|nr:sulfate adenylyltransferase subunit CysD [Pseudomonas poae]PRA29820.1 sulfate adenylyltransferase subunit CysD [Pseudomonas poae]PRC21779.1 sulfate adenylyltransferase subunit CysD [Pseudomonas poae]
MPHGNSLSVVQINQLRLRAVQLRIGGSTLKAISQDTGLSSPTIISAYKAWQAGGWTAVPVRERGRKPGEGRSLSPEQERAVYQLLVSTLPEQHQLPFLLWQLEAMQALVMRLHAIDLPERTAAHYLQRWQLNAERPAKRVAHACAAVQRWYRSTYRDILDQSRAQNGEIYWIDDYGARNDQGKLSHGVLRAVSNRGKVLWLPYEDRLRAPHLEAFFDRLYRSAERKVFTLLSGMHWQRAATFITWAGERSERFHLFHLPQANDMLHGARELATQINQQAARSTCEDPPATRAPSPPRDPMLQMLRLMLKHQIAQKSESQQSYVVKRQQQKARGKSMTLTHLQRLEAESIQAMREVVAEADNPVMLYSVGKDSAVMLHLAMKAFYPAKPPFPLLHVDTTWKFQEMYRFRDQMVAKLNVDLLTHINPEGIEMGISPFKHGSQIHTDIMKTEGLKQALDHYGFDAAFGGARRDEEKSRAKERIFSFRSDQHRWDPKNQRPELWHLYNTRKHKGESIRVFPLSNWTELDIWQYIHLENIPIVPLYFAAPRPVVERDGMLIMVDDERMPLNPGEVPMIRNVRFRTLGCYPLTGAVESDADTLPKIIQEMLLTRTSERQGRMIDHDASASMEKKKQEGYF